MKGSFFPLLPYYVYPLTESDIIQQSRADTCMLRYNQSSVLKLYAITRHVEPPGAVIFSTDDLVIKLNETASQQIRESYVAPIKHPKMKLKVKDDGRAANENQSQQVRMDKKLDQHVALVGAERVDAAPSDVGIVVAEPKNTAHELRKQKLREHMLNTNRIPESIETEEETKLKNKLNMNNVYKKYTYNANDGSDLLSDDVEKPYLYLPYDQMDTEAVCTLNY